MGAKGGLGLGKLRLRNMAMLGMAMKISKRRRSFVGNGGQKEYL